MHRSMMQTLSNPEIDENGRFAKAYVVLRKDAQPKLSVALAFPLGMALSERIQQGIASYARESGGWSFARLPERMDTSIAWLRGWRGDGAFVFVTTVEEARIARSLRIPVVNLASHISAPGIPTVSSDHAEMGRMAAEHLLSKRLRHVAFYGVADLLYSRLRLQGFEEAVRSCATFEKLIVPLPSNVNFRWGNQERALDRWLSNLPTPVGIFAGTDLRAGMILEACNRLGLSVPKEVAILGVDNDPLVCESRHPPLSSISRNDFEVGWHAAEVLEKQIQGHEVPVWKLVRPGGVVQRESTNALALHDALIARAVVRIHESIAEVFGVGEIAEGLPVSRRHFDARFRAAVGCSPYTYINELRVERAKSLLKLDPRRSNKEIAAACGFGDARRFGIVFKRITGSHPREWRCRTGEIEERACTGSVMNGV